MHLFFFVNEEKGIIFFLTLVSIVLHEIDQMSLCNDLEKDLCENEKLNPQLLQLKMWKEMYFGLTQ